MALDSGGEYHYLYKLLLIGDSGVGKSCLLMRFADSTYEENQTSTIGVDFKIRTVELGDKKVKLQMWDSAGQERFRAIASAYYRGAHGVGLVFDVTDMKTLESIESLWLGEIERNDCASIPRLLIGNKSDLEDRQVSEEEAVSFAMNYGMNYVETSAKTSENVSEAFIAITKAIFDKKYVYCNPIVLKRYLT